MKVLNNTPTIVVLAAVLAVAGACTVGAPAPSVATPALVVATSTPVATSAAAATSSAAATPAGVPQSPASTPGSAPVVLGDIRDLLVLRMANPTSAAAFTVIEPVQGQILFDIPDGIISRNWKALVSLAADVATTSVQVTNPEGGDLPVRISVPGAWRLPTVGVARLASGLSADGSTLVLEEAAEPAGAGKAGTTRFAIVATTGAKAPRIITLAGSFRFDALAPSGQWLYLLEYLPGGDPTHYRVRQLDVATGKLQDGSIVDKRNLDEQMSGYALTQEAGKAGWVYTLYRGADGVFIHALDTAAGVAFCIDLPGTDAHSAAIDGSWGLVADPSGAWLYVADPLRKTVSAISLADFTISRSGPFARVPTARLAKLESAQPTGGRAALSPDGKTLYVVDTAGVAVVQVADLVTTGHLGGSADIRSIAVGSAGVVYAVDATHHAVVLGTGAAASAPFVNGSYASIVAVAPIR